MDKEKGFYEELFEKVEIERCRLNELEEREQMWQEINLLVGAIDGKPVEKVRAFVQMHTTYGWCINNFRRLVDWLKENPPEDKVKYIASQMDDYIKRTNKSFKERFEEII